jgi:hypothetical protein
VPQVVHPTDFIRLGSNPSPSARGPGCSPSRSPSCS